MTSSSTTPSTLADLFSCGVLTPTRRSPRRTPTRRRRNRRGRSNDETNEEDDHEPLFPQLSTSSSSIFSSSSSSDDGSTLYTDENTMCTEDDTATYTDGYTEDDTSTLYTNDTSTIYTNEQETRIVEEADENTMYTEDDTATYTDGYTEDDTSTLYTNEEESTIGEETTIWNFFQSTANNTNKTNNSNTNNSTPPKKSNPSKTSPRSVLTHDSHSIQTPRPRKSSNNSTNSNPSDWDSVESSLHWIPTPPRSTIRRARGGRGTICGRLSHDCCEGDDASWDSSPITTRGIQRVPSSAVGSSGAWSDAVNTVASKLWTGLTTTGYDSDEIINDTTTVNSKMHSNNTINSNNNSNNSIINSNSNNNSSSSNHNQNNSSSNITFISSTDDYTTTNYPHNQYEYNHDDDITIQASNLSTDTTTPSSHHHPLHNSHTNSIHNPHNNPVLTLLTNEMDLSSSTPFLLPPPLTTNTQQHEPQHLGKPPKKKGTVRRKTTKLVSSLLRTKASGSSRKVRGRSEGIITNISNGGDSITGSPTRNHCSTAEAWVSNTWSQGSTSGNTTGSSSHRRRTSSTGDILLQDSHENVLMGNPLRMTDLTKDVRKAMKVKSKAGHRRYGSALTGGSKGRSQSQLLCKSASFSDTRGLMRGRKKKMPGGVIAKLHPQPKPKPHSVTRLTSTDTAAAIVGQNEDYITSTSTNTPVRVSPSRLRTSYEEMDDVIQGRLDGIDAIFLGSARSISYISDSQRHLAGQRYTPRSMIGDMLSGSCGGERPEIVLEGFSQGGGDRWIVCTQREGEGGRTLLSPNRWMRSGTELGSPAGVCHEKDVVGQGDTPGLSPPRRRSQLGNCERTTAIWHSPSQVECVGEEEENGDYGSQWGNDTMPHHLFLAQIWGKDNPPPPSHSLNIIRLVCGDLDDGNMGRGVRGAGNLDTIVDCPFDVDKGIYVLDNFDRVKSAYDAAVAPLKDGRFEDSIYIFRKIIKSLKNYTKKVPSHILGGTFHNLGIIQMWAGKYEDSLMVFLNAIHIRRRVLGPFHASVAVSLVRIGFVYFALEQLDEALNAFEKALEIRKQILQRGHLESAKIVNNIGVVYYQKGNYAAALKCFMEALQVQRLWTEKSIRRQSLIYETSVTLSNMGKVYVACDDYDMAFNMYEEALMLQTTSFNKDHNAIIESLGNVAFAKAKRGEKNNALRIYRSIHRSHVAKFGPQSREAAETVGLMSTIHTQQFNYKAAEKCLQDVLKWQVSNLDEHHPAIANTENTIETLKQAINGEVRVFCQ